ncbi:MAG: outer membrane beta-barrel protein [Bacteroidales bacterium]
MKSYEMSNRFIKYIHTKKLIVSAYILVLLLVNTSVCNSQDFIYKSEGQETQTQESVKKEYPKTYAKIGASFHWNRDEDIKEYFKSMPGYKLELGAEVARNIKIGLTDSHYWGKDKEYGDKCRVWDFSPRATYVLRNEEGDNLFNCGIGGKYRSIRVIYKDGEEDKIDGIGLTFFAGADINLKNDWKIFTELEYDKITGEYDGDEYPIGGTTWTLGFSRRF